MSLEKLKEFTIKTIKNVPSAVEKFADELQEYMCYTDEELMKKDDMKAKMVLNQRGYKKVNGRWDKK